MTSEAGNDFARDVLRGLSGLPKSLPCKYFYDARGSELFSDICDLEEYYVTRTEMALLKSMQEDLGSVLRPDTVVVEPGAGDGTKARLLLSAMPGRRAYLPYDISRSALDELGARMQNELPEVRTLPLHAQFNDQERIQQNLSEAFPDWPRLLFFPGSTLGNFAPDAAVELLGSLADLVGEEDHLLVGIDLVKDTAVLEAAYDDASGVTAAFNKNLLQRVNRELDADFNLEQFRHLAFFNRNDSRIEMHLVSECQQTVAIGSQRFDFSPGESIHTENSYKFTLDRFGELASRAGLLVERYWTDPRQWFAQVLLRRQGGVPA